MIEINIWDKKISPPKYKGKTILWNDYNNSNQNNLISINNIIEKNQIFLKKFLEIIYNFRLKKINEINLISYFLIRNKFSYWWMCLINEKSNISKSFYINDIIKLIALEMWLKENKVHFDLYSNKKELKKAYLVYAIN